MWTLEGFIFLQLWLANVPQYTTFLALSGFASQIGSLSGMGVSLGGQISEAYWNGKEKLAQYYVSQSFRYTGIIQCFAISLIILLMSIFEPIMIILGLEAYILGIMFIIPKMVRDFQQPYNNIAENTPFSKIKIFSRTGNLFHYFLGNNRRRD